MVPGALVAMLIAAGAGGSDSTSVGPRIDAVRVGAGAVEPDTIRPRRKAVVLTEAYHNRLVVHKWASYLTLPMFAAQYAAGDQLMKKGRTAPQWARDSHGLLAGGLAGLFAINSLTGSLNWWDTRAQEDGKTWRTVHSALMLLSDAGFMVTGLLAGDAEDVGTTRRAHKQVAVASMSVATVSYLMMLKPFRRD